MEPLPYLLLAERWRRDLPDLWAASGIYDLRWQDDDGNLTRPYPDQIASELSIDELSSIEHRINNIIEAYPQLSVESLEHQPDYEKNIPPSLSERAYYGAIDPLSRAPEGWEDTKSSLASGFYPKDIYDKKEFDNLFSNFTDYYNDQKKWIDSGYLTDEDKIDEIQDLGRWLEKLPELADDFVQDGRSYVKLKSFIPFSYDTKYTHKEFEGLVGKPIVERQMTDEQAESKKLSPIESALKEYADTAHTQSRKLAKEWAKGKENDVRWAAYQDYISKRPVGFFENFVPNEYWLDTFFGLVPSVLALGTGTALGLAAGAVAGPGVGVFVGTAATIGLMTPLEATGEYQEAYEYAMEKWGDEELAKEVARNATSNYLAIMGITELLPTGRYMKMAMPAKAARITAKSLNRSIYQKILHDPNVGSIFQQIGGTAKTRAKFHLANAGKQAFVEGLQEVTQYLGSVAVQSGYKDETFLDIYNPAEAASSILGGIMFGGVLGGGASAYGGKGAFKLAQARMIGEEVTQYGEIPAEEIVGLRSVIIEGEPIVKVVTKSMLEAEEAAGKKKEYTGKPLYRQLPAAQEGVEDIVLRPEEPTMKGFVSELLSPRKAGRGAVPREDIEDKKLKTLVNRLDKFGAGRQGEKLVATLQQGGKDFVDSLEPEQRDKINSVLKGAIGNINKDVLDVVKNPDNLIEDVLAGKISIDYEVDRGSGKIATPHRKTALTIKDKGYVSDLTKDYEQQLIDEFGKSPSAKQASGWLSRNLRLDISEEMLKEEFEKEVEKEITQPSPTQISKSLQAEHWKEFADQTLSKLEGENIVDEKGKLEKGAKGLTAMVINKDRYKGKYVGQIGKIVKFDKGANKVLMKMPDGKSLAFSVGTDIALTPESAEDAGVTVTEPVVEKEDTGIEKMTKVAKEQGHDVESIKKEIPFSGVGIGTEKEMLTTVTAPTQALKDKLKRLIDGQKSIETKESIDAPSIRAYFHNQKMIENIIRELKERGEYKPTAEKEPTEVDKKPKKLSQQVEEVLRLRDEVDKGAKAIEKAQAQRKTPPSMVPFVKMQKELSTMLKDPEIIKELEARGELASVQKFIEEDKPVKPKKEPTDLEKEIRKRFHEVGESYDKDSPIATKKAIIKAMKDIMGPHAPDIESVLVDEIKENPNAIGSYADGILQFILGQATEQTAVHEPIHWFLNRILTEEEYAFLAEKFKGKDARETEENMADAATQFYFDSKTFVGKIKNILKKFWNAIRAFFDSAINDEMTVFDLFSRIGRDFEEKIYKDNFDTLNLVTSLIELNTDSMSKLESPQVDVKTYDELFKKPQREYTIRDRNIFNNIHNDLPTINSPSSLPKLNISQNVLKQAMDTPFSYRFSENILKMGNKVSLSQPFPTKGISKYEKYAVDRLYNDIIEDAEFEDKKSIDTEELVNKFESFIELEFPLNSYLVRVQKSNVDKEGMAFPTLYDKFVSKDVEKVYSERIMTTDGNFYLGQQHNFFLESGSTLEKKPSGFPVQRINGYGWFVYVEHDVQKGSIQIPPVKLSIMYEIQRDIDKMLRKQPSGEMKPKISGFTEQQIKLMEEGKMPTTVKAVYKLWQQYVGIVDTRLRTSMKFAGEGLLWHNFIKRPQAYGDIVAGQAMAHLAADLGIETRQRGPTLSDSDIDNIIKSRGYKSVSSEGIYDPATGDDVSDDVTSYNIKNMLEKYKKEIDELREYTKSATKNAVAERLDISLRWAVSGLVKQEAEKPYHIAKLGQEVISHPDYLYWDGKYAPDVMADKILDALSPYLSKHGNLYKGRMKDFTKKLARGTLPGDKGEKQRKKNYAVYGRLAGSDTNFSTLLFGAGWKIPETGLISLPMDKNKRILAVKNVLTKLGIKPLTIKRLIAQLDKYDNYTNQFKKKDEVVPSVNIYDKDSEYPIEENIEFKESDWMQIDGKLIQKKSVSPEMNENLSLSRALLSGLLQMELHLRKIAFNRDTQQWKGVTGIYDSAEMYEPEEYMKGSLTEIEKIKKGDTINQRRSLLNKVTKEIGLKHKLKQNLDHNIKVAKGMLKAKESRYSLFKRDHKNIEQAVTMWVNEGNRQLKGFLKDKFTSKLLLEYDWAMIESINKLRSFTGLDKVETERFLNEAKTFRQKQVYTYILKAKDRGISTAGFAGAKAHSRLEGQDRFHSTSRLYLNDFELNDPNRVKTYEEFELKKIGDGGNLAYVDRIYGRQTGNHLKTDDMLLQELRKIEKINLPHDKVLKRYYRDFPDKDQDIITYSIYNNKTEIETTLVDIINNKGEVVQTAEQQALSLYRDAPSIGPIWKDTRKVLNSLNIPYEEKKYKELDEPIVISTLPKDLHFKVPRFHEKPNDLSDKEAPREHEYVNDGENIEELLRISGRESEAGKRESVRYYIAKAANDILNGLNEISNITQKGAVTPTGNLWDESAYNKSKEHFESAYDNLKNAYSISLEDFVKAMFRALKKIPAELRDRVREFLLKWAREKDSGIDNKVNTRNTSIGIIELMGLAGRKRARLSRELIDSGTMDRIVDSMLNRNPDADSLSRDGTELEDSSDPEEVSNDLAFWTESYDFRNEQFYKFLEESDSKGWLDRDQVSDLMKITLTGDRNLFMSHILGEYDFVPDTIEKSNMAQSFWVKNQEINRITGSEKPAWWYANLDEDGNRPKGRSSKKKLIPKVGGSSMYGKDIRSNKDLPSTYVVSFADWALKKNPYMGEEIKISRIYLNDIVDVWKGEKDDSGSNYFGKQAWIELGKGKDSLVRKWDNEFAAGVKDSKGNPVVRTVVEIKAGGSNPSFIVARVPEFVLEFSNDMEAVKGYFDTEVEMGNMTRKMAKNYVSSIEESNKVDGIGNRFAAAQHITMHEVMKKTHGSEYLMRTDDILHHSRRAQISYAEGIVPVGVGSHTVKIIDQSKAFIVTPDGRTEPMVEYIAGLAGRSRSDGASLVETEHLDSVAKSLGREPIQGGLPLREVKSVVWFNSSENSFSKDNYPSKIFRGSEIWEGVHYLALKHNDFVIDEGLKFVDGDGNVLAYSVKENNHIRIYDGDDNRITRLSTLDEAKEPDGGSGSFKLDGRVATDVLTLPEESLRVIKMPNQRPKNSAAFPFSWLSKLYESEFEPLRLDIEKRLLNIARANVQAMYDARKNPEVMASLFGQMKSDNTVFMKEVDALIEPIPGELIGDGYMHPHLIKGHIEPVKNKLIGQNAYGGRRRGFGNYPVIKSDIDGTKVSSYDGVAISEDDATMVNFVRQKLNLDRGLRGAELQKAFKESIRGRRPVYILAGRHPAYNISSVAQVKVENIVPAGHGNVVWFHPDMVSGPLQADQDGDNSFLHVMYFGEGFSDETVPRLMEQVKDTFKEKEAYSRIEIFKKKDRNLKVNSKSDMYKASQMIGTGINAQGVSTNAVTFFEDMHYKDFKATIGGQTIVARNPHEDMVVMDYAILNDDVSQEYLNDLNLGKLVNKDGKKWVSGDKYLMTTPSKELGLILQGAVDHVKELLLHDWKYGGYDFLIPKMFVQDTGAPIGQKQSRTIARLLRKELTYGGLRHGRDPDSRRSKSIESMFDDSQKMYDLSQMLGKARGTEIAKRANNRRVKNGENSRMVRETLPIEKLEFNNKLTTLEKLIAIPHEITVKYQKENPKDIVYGHPWGYAPNRIVNGITATQKELLAMQKTEQLWYPENEKWKPKKREAIAFINQLATEFYGIARRKEIFDEVMSESLTSASYPYADEIIDLVQKWYNEGDKKRKIKAFKDLDEQQQAYATLKFLRGTEPQMKQIRKGVQVRATKIVKTMVRVSERIAEEKSEKQKEHLRKSYKELRDDLDKLTTVTTINKQPRLRNIEAILPRQLMHPGVWSEFINRFGPNLRKASDKAVKLRMRRELGINELITKDCP